MTIIDLTGDEEEPNTGVKAYPVEEHCQHRYRSQLSTKRRNELARILARKPYKDLARPWKVLEVHVRFPRVFGPTAAELLKQIEERRQRKQDAENDFNSASESESDESETEADPDEEWRMHVTLKLEVERQRIERQRIERQKARLKSWSESDDSGMRDEQQTQDDSGSESDESGMEADPEEEEEDEDEAFEWVHSIMAKAVNMADMAAEAANEAADSAHIAVETAERKQRLRTQRRNKRSHRIVDDENDDEYELLTPPTKRRAPSQEPIVTDLTVDAVSPANDANDDVVELSPFIYIATGVRLTFEELRQYPLSLLYGSDVNLREKGLKFVM